MPAEDEEGKEEGKEPEPPKISAEQIREHLTEVSIELLGVMRDALSSSVAKLQRDGVLPQRVALKRSYLTSIENWLDFIVVAVSWLTFIIEKLSSGGGLKIKALRLLRLLKPLRAVKALPGLQMLVSVCGKLLHQLLTVYVLVFVLLFWWLALLMPLWRQALSFR